MGLETKIMNDQNVYDVLIIGAGPGGICASIYCRRANLKVGFIEKEVPGGKMVNTPIIENYPGFEKINGADLSLKMFEQSQAIGVEYIFGEVTRIVKEKQYHVVYTSDNQYRFAKAVIIATGTIENELNVEGEKEYSGKGVSYCAICDGSLAKNKISAVIGGGNSGLYNALYLSGICEHVYLIHRRDEFRAEKHIIDKLKTLKNVSLLTSCVVDKIKGDSKKVTSLSIKHLKDNKIQEIPLSYVFIYIGSNPAISFLDDPKMLNSEQIIIVDANMQTKVQGLYAIGDVNKSQNRQITTAISDGTIAALHAIKFIKEKWDSL